MQAFEPLKADDSLRDQLPRAVVEIMLLSLGRPVYPEVKYTVVADLVRRIDPGATVSMIEDVTATVLQAFDPATAQNALNAIWGTVEWPTLAGC